MTDSENTQQQTKFKVLLIGDSCIDQYRIGTVDRISPEAPIPIVKIVNEYQIPGMVANVQLNFDNLGIETSLITNGEEIVKTRYIDSRSGQHLLRVDNEPHLKPWDEETPFEINSYDAVVISDYNKGFLTYQAIENIIRAAGGPVFIDTKKSNLDRFNAEWCYIKINETEYKQRMSTPKNLIVTLGERGAMLKQHGDEMIYSTNPVEVMDVCGCGDTFLAALTTQYLYTKDIEKAIIFANIAAGITAQHRGNYAPNYTEISRAGH